MGNNLLSIDLGSKNMHFVSGRYNKGSIEVKQAFQKPTPESVIKDGKIEDFNTLKSAIRNILAENRVKVKDTVLSVYSTSVITRDITLPTVKHNEIDNMIKFEIEQYLPIVATEYMIEYTLIEEIMEDNIKKSKVQVAAMPKSMIDNYLNLVTESGLRPAALDIHSNATAKLFSNSMIINRDNYTTDKTIAFIDMGYRSINVHIVSKGKLVFSRIISQGAREIDSEISINCNLTIEQAEAKKLKEADLDSMNFAPSSTDKVNDIIRARVDSWLAEIQKIFQYYISRNTGNRIDGIYLFGGSSKIKGLSRYVELALNIKTSKIDGLGNVKLAKGMLEFSQEDYINALGGLIRYE